MVVFKNGCVNQIIDISDIKMHRHIEFNIIIAPKLKFSLTGNINLWISDSRKPSENNF